MPVSSRSPPYPPTIKLNKNTSKIWVSKPSISPTGLISSFALPPSNPSSPSAFGPDVLNKTLTASTFIPSGSPSSSSVGSGSFITSTSTNHIYSIHPSTNVYTRIYTPSSTGLGGISTNKVKLAAGSGSGGLGKMTCLSTSPNGSIISVGYDSGVICIGNHAEHDTTTKLNLTRLKPTHQTEIRSLEFIRDGGRDMMVSMSQDCVCLWVGAGDDDGSDCGDNVQFKLKRTISGDFRCVRFSHSSPPSTYSSNDKENAAGNSNSNENESDNVKISILFADSSITTYTYPSFHKTLTLPHPVTLEGPCLITTFAYTQDNRYILSAGSNCMLYLWRVDRGGRSGVVNVAEMPEWCAGVVDVQFIAHNSSNSGSNSGGNSGREYYEVGTFCILSDNGTIINVTFGSKGCRVNYVISLPNECITSFTLSPSQSKPLSRSQSTQYQYLVAQSSNGTQHMFDLNVARDTYTAVNRLRFCLRGSNNLGESESESASGSRNSGSDSEVYLHTRLLTGSNDEDDDEGGRYGVIKGGVWSGMNGSDTGVSGGVNRGCYNVNGDGKEDVTSDVIERAFSNGGRKVSAARRANGTPNGNVHGNVSDTVLLSTKPNPNKVRSSKSNSNSRSKSSEPMPLYKLASLTPPETRLNKSKLTLLLNQTRTFPSKYRVLCWRFLLRLPGNISSFSTLVNQPLHEAYTLTSLTQQHPLKNQRVLDKLVLHLSSLTHWSAICGEVTFLPALIYPFVCVFGTDDLSCFETLLSVLTHWGGAWFECYPHPPINTLNSITLLIKHFDADDRLMRHFTDLGVSAETYAWTLLRSMLTTVLVKSDWMVLVDHIFLNAHDKNLLNVFVACYTIYNRAVLLTVKSRREVEGFYSGVNGGVEFGGYLRLVLDVWGKLGGSNTSRSGSSNSNSAINIKNPTSISTSTSSSPHSDSDSSNTSFPLPSGVYPSFTGYPSHIVNFQISERDRLKGEDEDEDRKRRLLDALAARSSAVREEEEVWRHGRAALICKDEEERAARREKEGKSEEEGRRRDETARVARLDAVAAMEEAARLSILAEEDARERDGRRIDEDVGRLSGRNEYVLRQREEEESLLKLENQAAARVRGLQSGRREDERSWMIKRGVQEKEERMIGDDNKLIERLNVEDVQRKIERENDGIKREKAKEIRVSLILQQQIADKFAKSAADREARLADIERERRIRHVAEDSERRREHDIDVLEKQAEVEMRNEVIDIEALVCDARAWRVEQGRGRDEVVEEERRKYAIECEGRERRLEELQRGARRREYEKSMTELNVQEVKKTLEEEKVMQQALLTMESDRVRDRLHELRLKLKEDESIAKAQFQNALHGAEERIVAEERRRFIQIREALRNRASEQERDIAVEHEGKMAGIAEEQGRELDRVEEGMRRKVQMREAQSVAGKYTDFSAGRERGWGSASANASVNDSVVERARETLERVERR